MSNDEDRPNVVHIGRGRKQHIGLTDEQIAEANQHRDASHAVAQWDACGARKREKDSGQFGDRTCPQPRGWGTDHVGYGRCKWHGGNTPAGRKYAAVARAEAEVTKTRDAMRFFGARVAIDPADALLEELQRSAGIVRWLEEAIGAVQAGAAAEYEEDVNDGDRVATDQGTGLPKLIAVHTTDKAVGFTDTELAAWLKVYREERVHLRNIAKACVDAGIQERQQRLLEARAVMMGAVLQAAARRILGTEIEGDRLRALLQESIVEVTALPAGVTA